MDAKLEQARREQRAKHERARELDIARMARAREALIERVRLAAITNTTLKVSGQEAALILRAMTREAR